MPFPSGIRKILAGMNITVTSPTGPDTTIAASGGGGGGVASLSGAGVTESPGILDQSGGMDISDTEGDGFTVVTNGTVNITENSGNQNTISLSGFTSITGAPLQLQSFGPTIAIQMNAGAVGPVEIGIPASEGVAYIRQDGALTNPLTVVEGVNDTFIMTSITTGTPLTFTIASGTYSSVGAITAAINAANDGDGNTFNQDNFLAAQSQEAITLYDLSTNEPGTTITFGPTDVAADLGFSGNPVTAVASPGDSVEINGETLSFFGVDAVAQQASDGTLDGVIAALVAYGLLSS